MKNRSNHTIMSTIAKCKVTSHKVILTYLLYADNFMSNTQVCDRTEDIVNDNLGKKQKPFFITPSNLYNIHQRYSYLFETAMLPDSDKFGKPSIHRRLRNVNDPRLIVILIKYFKNNQLKDIFNYTNEQIQQALEIKTLSKTIKYKDMTTLQTNNTPDNELPTAENTNTPPKVHSSYMRILNYLGRFYSAAQKEVEATLRLSHSRVCELIKWLKQNNYLIRNKCKRGLSKLSEYKKWIVTEAGLQLIANFVPIGFPEYNKLKW